MPTYTLSPHITRALPHGLDQLGELLDLPRLPGEANETYRQRLWESRSRPGNATMVGLTWAITRGLGLEVKEAVRIQLAQPQRIRLQHQLLEIDEARFFLREARYWTLSQLIAVLAALPNLTITLLDADLASQPSFGLMPVDNLQWWQERVPATRRFTLSHAPLATSSIHFSENEVFARHRTIPSQPGDFFLDLTTGRVEAVSYPSGNGSVSYFTYATDIILHHSPLGLLDLNSSPARQWFFQAWPRDVWSNPEESTTLYCPHLSQQWFFKEFLQQCPCQWGDR